MPVIQGDMQKIATLALEGFYKVERAVMYGPPMQRCHANCDCIIDKDAGRKEMLTLRSGAAEESCCCDHAQLRG